MRDCQNRHWIIILFLPIKTYLVTNRYRCCYCVSAIGVHAILFMDGSLGEPAAMKPVFCQCWIQHCPHRHTAVREDNPLALATTA